jgi:hypothetical protein
LAAGRPERGDGVHGFGGGFEYAAWEARRELLEEARAWRLARLARPRRGLGERLATLLRACARLPRAVWPGARAGEEFVPDGKPDFVYLARGEPGTAVEIYLSNGGCVVRKMDLRTGASTDAFVRDGSVRQ